MSKISSKVNYKPRESKAVHQRSKKNRGGEFLSGLLPAKEISARSNSLVMCRGRERQYTP
jgi:hypothetical protein